MTATIRTKQEAQAFRWLRSQRIFDGCGDHFLALLAAGAEQFELPVGGAREMGNCRAEAAHPVVLAVLSGACRVEVNRCPVEDLKPGASIGMASVLAASASNSRRAAELDATHYMSVRCLEYVAGEDTAPRATKCHCLVLRPSAMQRALRECADELPCAGVLAVLRRPGEVAQPFLNELNCSEVAATVVVQSSTRHVYMAGDVLCSEGKRTPDGMVLIRSGSLVASIAGKEVRRLTEGQVVGEDMLLDVSQRWTLTLTCETVCDIQVLRRGLFIRNLRGLSNKGAEGREAANLLSMLVGSWKDERVILSLPLFRGYEPEFLSTIARLMEIRVILPGALVWDCASKGVATLCFVLSGSCEEANNDRGRTPLAMRGRARGLMAGGIIGTNRFLGLKDPTNIVLARVLSIVAILYRNVFLDQVDRFLRPLVAPEVTRLLSASVTTQVPSKGEKVQTGIHRAFNQLPLLRGCEPRFVERLCASVTPRLFMDGQNLCRDDLESSTLFLLRFGKIDMSIAGLFIRGVETSEAVNLMALSCDGYVPSYTLACGGTTEVLTLTRSDFLVALEMFPAMKLRFAVLISNPVRVLGMTTGYALREEPVADNSLEVQAAETSLRSLKLFSLCSKEFLEWIREHLETVLCYPDEVLLSENSDDARMYFVSSGTLINCGTATYNCEVTLVRGAFFGEWRALGLASHVGSTYTGLETAIVQVLHQSVLAKAFVLFPEDQKKVAAMAVQIFGTAAMAQSKGTIQFKDCQSTVCAELDKHLAARLVNKGEVLCRRGDPADKLLMLCHGVATCAAEAAEPATLSCMSMLNLDVALGVTKRCSVTVRAEQSCLIREVDVEVFRGIVRHHPDALLKLAAGLNGGQAWPSERESVPLFRGVSPPFFEQLMHLSVWNMLPSGHHLVTEGVAGSRMFVVCSGAAARKLQGLIVGHALDRGEVVGALNFLGVDATYRSSVQALSVCHARSADADVLVELLDRHHVDRENINGVRRKAIEDEKALGIFLEEELVKTKMRNRARNAFQKHIESVRDVRGFDAEEEAFGTDTLADHWQLQLKQLGFQQLQRQRGSFHGPGHSSSSGKAADAGRSGSHKNHRMPRSKVSLLGEMLGLPGYHASPVAKPPPTAPTETTGGVRGLRLGAFMKSKNAGVGGTTRGSQLARGSHAEEPTKTDGGDGGAAGEAPPSHRASAPSSSQLPRAGSPPPTAGSERRPSKPNSSSQRLRLSMSMSDEEEDASDDSGSDRAEAFATYADMRQKALVKGKFKRLLQNGMRLDSAVDNKPLTQEEVAMLNDILPPPRGDAEDRRRSACKLRGRFLGLARSGSRKL